MANCDSKHNSYQQLILQPKNKTTRNKKRCIKTNDSNDAFGPLEQSFLFKKCFHVGGVFFCRPEPQQVACTAEADGGLLSTQAQIDVTRRLLNTSATEAGSKNLRDFLRKLKGWKLLFATSFGKSQQFGNMWKTKKRPT